MTEQEARAEAARLTVEHPESTWMPTRERSGEWAIARIGMPSRGPTHPTTEPGEPPPREDPRPPINPAIRGY
jgi:hypothetical protein